MIPRTTLTRAATATALVLGALTWGASSPAAAATAAAAVGPVTCVGQGRIEVTLTAGDDPATFWISVENSFAQTTFYDEREAAPGESTVVEVAGLADDDYSISVDVYEEVADDVEEGIEPLVETQRTVSCESTPTGPYSNARGALNSSCSSEIEVYASNRPIGGNAADLLPVEFTVTYVPSEETPGDEEPDSEEPGDEEPDVEEPGDEEPVEEEPRRAAVDPVIVDTFTLDAQTPTFHDTYAPTDDSYFAGTVTLTAGGEVLATSTIGVCVASPGTAGEGGAGLPNTGA